MVLVECQTHDQKVVVESWQEQREDFLFWGQPSMLILILYLFHSHVTAVACTVGLGVEGRLQLNTHAPE